MVATAARKTQLNVRVSEETRRLADLAAACESRPLGEIISDAVRLYVRSHSDGYRAFFEVAGRFLEAPRGSEEEAVARAELAQGIMQQHAIEPDDLSGDALVALARLREREAGN